ncbi:MAG TPA: hypothetical protein VJ032_05535 [Thermoanaerobaculia bacterium]|nr:hypothetical protein [Thermoanaerobaculia bacterium]
MTIDCKHLDNLLLEGDPFSMQQAAEHASGCAECMQTLTDWNEMSATASTMRTTWKSDTLWPRIERSIRQEPQRSHTSLWQIAAAILLATGIGVFAFVAHRRAERNEFDQSILRVAAVDEVERAEKAHIVAIEHLEQVTDAKLENASSPLMVSYKEKLMMLDDAIAECQSNIQHNRQNAHLRKQLLAMYSEKQRTLQDVAREGNHAN